MRHPRTTGMGIVAALVLTVPAHAHMVSTGIGPFYDGLSHVFVTPLDLLCLLAAVILAGLGGRARARVALAGMLLAWCAGVPLGALLLSGAWPLAPVFSMLLIVIGAMVALDRRWPEPVSLVLLPGLNGLLALQAGAGLLDEAAPLQLCAGILTGVGLVLILGTAFVVSRPSTWQRIALRAAGSWLAAIGLMSLAWSLQGTGT